MDMAYDSRHIGNVSHNGSPPASFPNSLSWTLQPATEFRARQGADPTNPYPKEDPPRSLYALALAIISTTAIALLAIDGAYLLYFVSVCFLGGFYRFVCDFLGWSWPSFSHLRGMSFQFRIVPFSESLDVMPGSCFWWPHAPVAGKTVGSEGRALHEAR